MNPKEFNVCCAGPPRRTAARSRGYSACTSVAIYAGVTTAPRRQRSSTGAAEPSAGRSVATQLAAAPAAVGS